MSRTRNLLATAFTGALLGALLYVGAHLPVVIQQSRHSSAQKQCEAIRIGMTTQEALKIINGGSPPEYSFWSRDHIISTHGDANCTVTLDPDNGKVLATHVGLVP